MDKFCIGWGGILSGTPPPERRLRDSRLGGTLVIQRGPGFRRSTETDSPTPYSGVRCCLGSLAFPSLHPIEKKTHRCLVILKVENQGLLSSISLFLVFRLLGKPLGAKPKPWLHPMFPSEETSLVIENRDWFSYSHS